MALKHLGRNSGGCCRGIQRPAEMLARMPASDGEGMLLEHFIIKCVAHMAMLANSRAALPRARCEITRDLTRQPRTALHRATNHEGMRPRNDERAFRIFAGTNIAIDDDWN